MRDPRRGVYKRLVLEGRPAWCGAVLYGDVKDGALVLRADPEQAPTLPACAAGCCSDRPSARPLRRAPTRLNRPTRYRDTVRFPATARPHHDRRHHLPLLRRGLRREGQRPPGRPDRCRGRRAHPLQLWPTLRQGLGPGRDGGPRTAACSYPKVDGQRASVGRRRSTASPGGLRAHHRRSTDPTPWRCTSPASC